MARQRRGGFKPPDVRGTLGSILRTTIEQASVVRDVIERTAREGRTRFDDARAGRKRSDALAELGEIVLDLIRRGEIDPAELPETHDVLETLDQIDEAADHGRRSDEHDDGEVEERVTLPPSRSRFDDRGSDRGAGAGAKPGARPASTTLPGSTKRRDVAPARADDDGTVSAGSARSWTPTAGTERVWRPTVAATPGAKPAATGPRKGGISFDDPDDEDLEAYMHPDDVPPKPSDP